MHCAEIWCMAMEQPAMDLGINATSGVHLHVLACLPVFRSSESTGLIMPKYGLLLNPLAVLFTQAISR